MTDRDSWDRSTERIAYLTLENLRNLPATLDARQVADVWGCSPWAVYQMVRAGDVPVQPLRLGRKLRWPTSLVLRSVGLDSADEA